MSEILRVGRSCWTKARGEEAGLLVDGRDYYRAFWETARRAKRSILMLGWQFDSEVRLLRGSDARGADAPVETRLRPHPMDTAYKQSELLERLVPADVYFDPDRAELEENVWEAMSIASEGPFAKGLSALRRWLRDT